MPSVPSSDWAVATWVTKPNVALGGETPIALLRSGHQEPVPHVARALALRKQRDLTAREHSRTQFLKEVRHVSERLEFMNVCGSAVDAQCLVQKRTAVLWVSPHPPKETDVNAFGTPLRLDRTTAIEK